jgi:Fe-S cluster assembly protein SufD
MPLTPWLSHYKTDFELARRRRGESIQFDDLRCEAFDRFLLLGFPTANDESWRSIDVTPLAETYFTMGAKPADGERDATVADLSLRDACVELVFANGYLMAARSRTSALPNGAIAAPLASLLASNADELAAFFARVARIDHFPLVALNTALFEDGAAILVPPRTAIEAPIHVRFISTGEADATPAMSQPRVLVVLGEESCATVVESYAGPDDVHYFTNAVTEVVLGNGASLDHYTVQGESTAAYLTAATHVIAGTDANYRSNAVAVGGAFIRDERIVTLAGERATCTLNGFYVADGNRLLNTHALIDHAAPGCVCRERHTSILAGRARGVFSRSSVCAESQKTRTRLVARALLSPNARLETPQPVAIEPLPDDDPATRARVIGGFTRAPLNRLHVPSLRTSVEQLFERRLERLR